MKKLLALLLVFAMCFGILAACGQNNSEGTEPPATTTAPPAPAEDPDLASAVAYVKNILQDRFREDSSGLRSRGQCSHGREEL